MTTPLERLLLKDPGSFKKTADHPLTLTTVPISLNPQHLVHSDKTPISDRLYSGFLEHLGRCIYGGLVDNPKAPSPPELLEAQDKGDDRTKGRLGWRKDVQKILSKDGELEIPMMRWPGGNFVSNYHWQDGIGPISQRPKRIELAWLSDELNLFGTDEFIDLCRANKWEPYICLNMGTGTYEEALAWLEYCNGTGDTHWANLRRKNTGRDEPHKVKYWGLGNEMYGPWQLGNLSASDYAKKAKMWAHGLKLVDPSIKLVSCGCTGADPWDREVLDTLIHYVDYHSIHFYTMLGHVKESSVPGLQFEKNVFGPAAAERYIKVCKSLIDMANIYHTPDRLPVKEVKICFDEWNVWDDEKAPGSVGLEQTYDYTDMLGFVSWLHVLVRQHKDVPIACLAQSVNVISPLMTRPNGLLCQTTFYPLQLFSKYMKGGPLLQLPTQKEFYTGPTFPTWIQQNNLQPVYIDTVAMLADAHICLSILNRHPEADYTLSLDFAFIKCTNVKRFELYSDDLEAVNTFTSPETIKPETTAWTVEEWTRLVDEKKMTVRKHSWQFFIFYTES